MSIATIEQNITEHEAAQVERANASSATPVVFIHGLWLLPSSWDNWVTLFEEAGYVGLTPAWPDDPETVDEARANPEVLAKKTLKQVADHTTEIINALDRKPVVIGHSTGACWRRCSRAGASRRPRWRSTPESSAAFCLCRARCSRGSARSWSTRARAAARSRSRSTSSNTAGQTRWTRRRRRSSTTSFHVAASGISLVQMGNANLNPWTEAKVDTKNPDRGPLLIIDGEKDHTVPWAIANAAYKRQRRNPGVTEIVKIPNRGHSLTIDHGWREVAETSLEFVKRFA